MKKQPHPAKAVIVGRGERITDVAAVVGVNAHTFGRVLNRNLEAWPALRSRLSEYLGLPEEDLFSARDDAATERGRTISRLLDECEAQGFARIVTVDASVDAVATVLSTARATATKKAS